MTLTELRDTLAAVSDAVPVPTPDTIGFQREVRRARRRRVTARATAGVAAAAVVAVGSSFALSMGGDAGDRTAPAHDSNARAPHWVPVVVGGHLRIVDGSILGPEGPAVASVVGTTSQGTVVLTEDATLAMLREQSSQLEQLVPGKVRLAYLDGEGVTYEGFDDLIHFWGITPTVKSTDSAHTDEGRLWAAGGDVYVESGGSAPGLSVHTAEGIHQLRFDETPTTIHGADVGGDVIAVRADNVVVFFDKSGLQTEERGGGQLLGSLSPDGEAYAQLAPTHDGVLLVDPESADGVPVEGPAGPVSDLGWAPDGDLLVVVGSSTLWRCSSTGTDCAAQVDDPTGTLSLG